MRGISATSIAPCSGYVAPHRADVALAHISPIRSSPSGSCSSHPEEERLAILHPDVLKLPDGGSTS